MIYAIIKDDKIFCVGRADVLPSGAVEVPCVLDCGRDIREYDAEYTLRPLADRVADGLVAVPPGYVADGETVREMTTVEKIKAGFMDLPPGMKIESDELVPMTDREMYNSGQITKDEYMMRLRAERDRRIEAIQWRIERYSQQIAAGIVTNDSADWYCAALVYIQALRDVPQQPKFPEIVMWPDKQPVQ